MHYFTFTHSHITFIHISLITLFCVSFEFKSHVLQIKIIVIGLNLIKRTDGLFLGEWAELAENFYYWVYGIRNLKIILMNIGYFSKKLGWYFLRK